MLSIDYTRITDSNTHVFQKCTVLGPQRMTIGSGVKIAKFGVKSLCGFVPVLAHNLQNPLNMRSQLGLYLAASVSKPEDLVGQGSTFSLNKITL